MIKVDLILMLASGHSFITACASLEWWGICSKCTTMWSPEGRSYWQSNEVKYKCHSGSRYWWRNRWAWTNHPLKHHWPKCWDAHTEDCIQHLHVLWLLTKFAVPISWTCLRLETRFFLFSMVSFLAEEYNIIYYMIIT